MAHVTNNRRWCTKRRLTPPHPCTVASRSLAPRPTCEHHPHPAPMVIPAVPIRSVTTCTNSDHPPYILPTSAFPRAPDFRCGDTGISFHFRLPQHLSIAVRTMRLFPLGFASAEVPTVLVTPLSPRFSCFSFRFEHSSATC